MPEWIQPYFSLPPIHACEVELDNEHGTHTLIHPMCTTLPMGWSHSVYLAQAAHEHLLNTKTSFSPLDRITSNNDFNVDRVRHQVYIDDLNMFGPNKDDIVTLQQQYIDVAASVGLPVKMSKVVSPSSDGVQCLGIQVHGRRKEVGLAVDKLVNLCHETVSLVNSKVCTGLALSRIIGKWTWAALVNLLIGLLSCSR